MKEIESVVCRNTQVCEILSLTVIDLMSIGNSHIAKTIEKRGNPLDITCTTKIVLTVIFQDLATCLDAVSIKVVYVFCH